MKTTPHLILALASVGILATASAQASGIGAYAKVDAGAAWTQDVGVTLGTLHGNLKTKSGQAFNGIFGIHVAESVALEFENGYQENDLSTLSGYGEFAKVTGSATVVPLLLNVVWTPKLSESISAQIGVGAGATVINADLYIPGVAYFPSDTKTVLSGQAKAGLSYYITEAISLDVTYRLRVSDGPAFSSGIKTDSITSHLVSAGFTFKF
jgi:opacity protein-like surface antigen